MSSSGIYYAFTIISIVILIIWHLIPPLYLNRIPKVIDQWQVTRSTKIPLGMYCGVRFLRGERGVERGREGGWWKQDGMSKRKGGREEDGSTGGWKQDGRRQAERGFIFYYRVFLQKSIHDLRLEVFEDAHIHVHIRTHLHMYVCQY